MPLITDWMMVGITLIYVIATIAIWRANKKSISIMEQQVAEMKKQYEEDNRPRIEIELVLLKRQYFTLRFVNRGKITASDVLIDISQQFIDSMPENSNKELLYDIKGKTCIIGVGQCHDVYLGGMALKHTDELKPLEGKVTYESNGKTYTADFHIDVKDYATFYSVLSEEEQIVQALDRISNHLRNLNAR